MLTVLSISRELYQKEEKKFEIWQLNTKAEDV